MVQNIVIIKIYFSLLDHHIGKYSFELLKILKKINQQKRLLDTSLRV